MNLTSVIISQHKGADLKSRHTFTTQKRKLFRLSAIEQTFNCIQILFFSSLKRSVVTECHNISKTSQLLTGNPHGNARIIIFHEATPD